MAAPINYAQLLADPEALKKLQEAQAAAMAQTPIQPEVQGIEEPKMSASFSMTSLPQSEKEIQAAIRQKFMEAQAQQEEQVKQHQDALTKEMQRQEQLGVLGRLDLRPFAQALQQYGSTTAVVPTEAPKDRTAVIEKLREQIQKGQRGLTEDQLGFLKTMMEDKRNAQAAMSESNQQLRIRSLVNTSEQAKKIRNIGSLNKKLAGLEELVQKTGAELTGKEKAALDSAFKDAEVAWKEAANLGALQGPDIEMIRGALGESPTSLRGIGRYGISGGKEGLLSKIRGARQRASDEGRGHLENVMVTFPYAVADPIFKDLEKKIEVPKTEAQKLREELKALKGE
jgi:hypothetical protein